MSGYLAISYLDIALAALLLVANALLSLWLGLGLTRQLTIAALRMAVQLVLVGLVLKVLFALASPWWTALAALVMGLFAGREILARQERRLGGWWGFGLGTSTMLLAGTLVMGLALIALLRPEPWYDPRFALPLFGMVLGNAMTGISLGLDNLTATLNRDKAAVEAQLLLGATRWQAAQPLLRRALKTGFMPIINSMAATGVVSLPGMMTGQILAGVAPTEAVKYQLFVMCLIGGATGLGVLMAVFGGLYRLSDARHRLRLDRLAG